MDEQRSPRATPLVELIEQVLAGTASDQQKRELDARLLASPEDRRDYLHHLNLHSALKRQFAYGVGDQAPPLVDAAGAAKGVTAVWSGPTALAHRWLWATAAGLAAAVLVVVSVYLSRPGTEPPIVTITRMNGALQWTGDGGRVVRDLEAGSSLRGGTLESLAADSWALLTFCDGSTVTVSGQSTLTISEDRQKQMHLREGSISASVAQQPPGRPMLIHTPTARLEVLGTQLTVDAEVISTALRVNEGRVRATRLSDGSVAEVPADHQVIVSTSRRAKLDVKSRPQSVPSWQSTLPTGAIYGQWVPDRDGPGGRLRGVPVLLNPGKGPTTLHLVAISACRGSVAPVVPAPGGRFRIRGRVETSGDLYFGITMKHVKGGFAGKYVTARKLDVSGRTGRSLDIELPVEEFRPQEKEFPPSPVGLELVDWWCFTDSQDAGLSIAGVELLPPRAATVATRPTAPPPRVPLMDIWAAAAQGNVKAVKRHLAAGARIDGAFVAPGIPASGATPLHMAVLCNQGDMAGFLIQRGADLNVRAKDKHGGTPLHWAAALGRVEMAVRLMEAGADINAPDNNAFTPLDATDYDPKSRKDAKRKIAELLRARGARRRPPQREGPET